MFSRLILQIIAAISSLWLATQLVPGVEFVGEIRYLFFAGAVLGFANFFIKPIIKFITLPLRMITLGLFSLVINMGLIWLVTVIFPELVVPLIAPLLWTTLLVWLVTFFLSFYRPRKKEK